MAILTVVVFLLTAFPQAPASDSVRDPLAIIQRAVDADERNWKVARNYTWTERDEERSLDSAGVVKKTETNTYEVTMQEGEPYYRLVKKNDQPLSEKDEKKEREKLEKSIREHEKETPEQHAKRLAKYEKEREEGRRFLREVTEAYNFKLEGAEAIAGRDCWVISAEPRPGFQAKMKEARILPKLRGKVWIDREEYLVPRAEIEVIDTISFGLSLVRLHAGSHVRLENTRVNDEVWLPKLVFASGSARVAYLKNFREEDTTTYRDYKKFQVESRVLP